MKFMGLPSPPLNHRGYKIMDYLELEGPPSLRIFVIEFPTAKFNTRELCRTYVHYVVCDPEARIYNSTKSLAACLRQDFVKI